MSPPCGGMAALGENLEAQCARDWRGDLTDRSRVLLLRQTAVTEPQRANETAVDDEVGIAADRRGEMRIAAQIQAEMPVIFRRIFGLRLRAQHNLVDKLLDVAAF